MLSENEVLYSDYAYVEGLKIWNFATRSNKTLSIPGKEAGYASRYVVYPWRGKCCFCSITSFMKQIVPCRY